ncbi:leucine-rich repeats and immunoglobulin-like domains protein 1 [Parasteatoda tepidariorum]|uniref:leucine-rich repeats and immunoglobulin-like domains protein 1 n=1 Tax=Parasteatoda tepidariorum TaxID=114398 RepID=UPI00077FB74E|nr:slit homolog 3 protein [Parasteatoda tepidariorum]
MRSVGNMGKQHIIFLELVFFGLTFVYGGCPSAYKILPCKCEIDSEGKTIINCGNIQLEEDLSSAMFAMKNQKIYMLQLESSSFMFFPDGLFMDLKVEVLKIKNSSIFSLGEGNTALTGLEDTLEELRVSDCTYVNNWVWSELSKMKWLRTLEISGSNLLELPNLNISHLPIEELNFKNNFFNELPFQAFKKFTKLKRFSFDYNNIIDIMRSMLPMPAKNLEAISLSYNKIKRLPINAFDQMPALKYLYLGGNPMKTLNEDVFKPVWNQLKMALFHSCPLVCDCQILWIPKSKQSKMVLIGGTCDSPMQLKDKRLTQLLPKHFPSC